MALTLSGDAQNVVNQAGAGAMDYLTANASNYGNKLTSGEASSILSNYKPQASQVYSPTNVNQTMTAPAAAPNYADPFALRDFYYNTPELTTAKNDVKNLTNQLNTFDTGQNQQQNYLENQTIAMPVITGEQANQARLGATQREAIARDLLARQSFLDTANQEAGAKYSIAQEQRGQLQDLIRQTGGKAGISYADTYDQAIKKTDTYLTKKAEDEAKAARKQAEKDALTNLYMQTFGTTPKKGMKTKDIQKKLGQSAKQKKAFEDQMNQLELQTKQTALASAKASLNRSGSSTSSSGLATLLTRAAQMPSGGREWAASVASTFGVNPDAVRQATAQNGWEAAFLSGAAAKPPTQAQQTVAGYASRMQQSQGIINQLEDVGSSATGYVAQYMPNLLKSGDRQSLEQAQRDFTNAILRRESGAAISSSEFGNAAQQYFPQPGDSAQVVAQKRANRDNAIQGLVNASGNAIINAPTQYGGNVSVQDQIDELINSGYTQEQINTLLGQ